MPALKEVVTFLDDILELDKYPADASNNGLQFQGVNDVRKAVFAVDACEAVFTIAADIDADFIFVHHGISWGNGIKRIQGVQSKRITALAANGISLYGAHLPLDANPLIGHNALLSNIIGLNNLKPFGNYHGHKIGFQGTLEKPMTPRAVFQLLDKHLPSKGDGSIIGNPTEKISNIAVISGGGAYVELFDEIYDSEVECLVTGTAGHEVFHPALETGTTIITLGHYRSEIPGVIAVMNSLAQHFGIETEFVDVPTGL